MTTASVVCALFGTLWGLDALRLRGRARSLAVLTKSDEEVSSDYRFIVRPGVVVDDETRRAASAFARANDFEVVDLVPGDLPAWRTMLFLQSVDPAKFRSERLARGRTAGEAFLVRASVLERMQHPGDAPDDPVAFAALAAKLKLFACTRMAYAAAPTLRAAPAAFLGRGRLIRHLYGEFALPVVLVQLALAMAMPAFSLPFGIAALAALHLQCALATLGTALAPRDRVLYTLFRTLIDAASVLTWLAPSPPRTAAVAAAVTERRAVYAGLLAEGTPKFFEARRTDCPVCGGTALRPSLSTGDRYQFKPGRFTIERCDDCAHMFQNPRLSIEGLGFYYRDFYDGLGGDMLEGIFGFGANPYIARAQIVASAKTPSRWLDVGAGHGHFCCVAREVWPEARFDGLDLSESIDDAVRRNWVDRGYRGLFPELAPTIAGGEAYDVVSMSHYLEHTRDPAAEIEAAGKVLSGGGLLMIEVPDPESRIGKMLGSFWLPWFQPQHQHLLSARNLERLLRAHDFEPIVWHRGEAHQSVDLTFMAFLMLNNIARPVDLPWRAPTHALQRVWNSIVWWAGIPFLLGSWIIDRIGAPFLRREGWSNTYRVLARRAG